MSRRYQRFSITLMLLFATFSFAQAPAAQTKTPRQAQKQTATQVQKGKAAQQPQPWKKIPIPTLPAFKPAQPKRIALSNGMIIFLQEDHELPLIEAVARIRGGSRVEPSQKVGLTDIYGEVWRTGGTKTKTGDQLDDYLEARAAKVETDGNIDSTSISLSCLKQDFDDVFTVFLDLLRNPEFRDEKMALAKQQMDTAISRRNDDIGEIASRESTMLAYGNNNPYARIAEFATVAAVTREDLIAWHDRYVHPNNIIFGIVGDFDSAAMEAKLRASFESWSAGPKVEPPAISFAEPKPGLYFAEKGDVNQSDIRMVALGIERNNPDYFAVTVMNEIFGGGFSSRLFRNIRTKEGLAYSVGGGIGSGFDHPGVFRLAMGTKIATTTQAIESLNRQITDLVKQPPTEDELKLAKDSILNSFIFNFDEPDKVLRERMAYEFYGYPQDFLEQYRAGVEKVTITDVTRVAQKYVHPGNFATLVVSTSEAAQELAKLGPVTKLDISIPQPGQQAAKTAAPTSAEAKALLAKVVDAMGGDDKVQSIKSIRETATSTVKTPQGDMQIKSDSLVQLPDKAAIDMTTPMGPMKIVTTPTAAFMSMAGQIHELPASQKTEMSGSLRRDPLLIAQHANDPKYTFTLGGSEKIGNVQAQIVDIDADGTALKWYVDPQTGHVLRETHTGMGPTGPSEIVVDYSDWKAIDGLTLPLTKISTQNGQTISTEKTENRQLNPAIDPKAFEKPAATPAS